MSARIYNGTIIPIIIATKYEKGAQLFMVLVRYNKKIEIVE